MGETVWMQAPESGEVREVASGSEELVQLMVAGWVQVAPPAEKEK